MDRTRQAAGRGAELVLFPAYLGMFLLAAGWRFDDDLDVTREAIGNRLRWAYLEACARVAQAAGVYLAPGSILEPCPGGWWHACYLFSPDGAMLARRTQLHVNPCEAARGIMGGNAVETVATPWGKVGFVLGSDARYPEVARILALQGAWLLLAPAAHPAPGNPWQQLAGLWVQAQSNQLCAAEACLQGELGGVSLGGRSVVYAPNEVTPDATGVLARADEEGLLVVPLYPDLGAGVRRWRVFDLMQAGLYARDLPPAYEAADRGGSE